MSSPDRLLRLRAVQSLIPLGKSAIYARVQAGTFPQPIKLGGRAVAWRQSEVEAWMAALYDNQSPPPKVSDSRKAA